MIKKFLPLNLSFPSAFCPLPSLPRYDEYLTGFYITNSSSNNLSVLLGNGDGTLSNAINFNVGESPGSVAVGEFNGDSISDVAVANSSFDNLVSLN